MNGEYTCKKCRRKWGFFPEDYDNPNDYPTICPLCSMPVEQMVKDVYPIEGIKGVKRFLKLRMKKK